MAAAGESDAGVMKRMEERRAEFEGLTVDAVALKMPRLQAGGGDGCVRASVGACVLVPVCKGFVSLQGLGSVVWGLFLVHTVGRHLSVHFAAFDVKIDVIVCFACLLLAAASAALNKGLKCSTELLCP
jgi:hypothetical protein